MQPQKIAVFGASGFLGEHITRELLTAGYEVIAAVRQKPDAPGFTSERLCYCQGDLADVDYIRRVLADVDGVIFSAGCIWKPGLAVSDYSLRNVEITENFFRALGERPQVRVVYTSSMSAIAGSRQPYSFTETSGREQVSEQQLSPYDQTKIRCEAIALESAARGNNVLVLNPGNMLGPGANLNSHISTTMLVLWFCQKNFPFFVNGGHSYCDVRDVAKAHVTALKQGQAGERYILAGHNLTMARVCQQLVSLTDYPAPRELPARAIYLLSILLEFLATVTGGWLKNAYHPAFARSFPLYYFANSQKAIDELGYQITPIETTLLDTIRDFYDRGLLSAELAFIRQLTPSNACELHTLRQLAGSHAFARFLLTRISEIHQICLSNISLQRALAEVTRHSQRNPRTGQLQLRRSACQTDLKVLQKLFEYLYFASDDFLSRVL